MMLPLASSGNPGTVLPQGNYKLFHCWQNQALSLSGGGMCF